MSDTQKPTPAAGTETETDKINREEAKLPNHGVSPDITDAEKEGEGHGDERD